MCSGKNRKAELDNLIQRILERDRINGSHISLSDINYKVFVEPSCDEKIKKKRVKLHSNEYKLKPNEDLPDLPITKYKSTEFTKNKDKPLGEIQTITSTAGSISLDSLTGLSKEQLSKSELIANYIENDLKSNFVKYMYERRKAKLINSEEYLHWHQKTKKEIRRLEKYFNNNILRSYVQYVDEIIRQENAK